MYLVEEWKKKLYKVKFVENFTSNNYSFNPLVVV